MPPRKLTRKVKRPKKFRESGSFIIPVKTKGTLRNLRVPNDTASVSGSVLDTPPTSSRSSSSSLSRSSHLPTPKVNWQKKVADWRKKTGYVSPPIPSPPTRNDFIDPVPGPSGVNTGKYKSPFRTKRKNVNSKIYSSDGSSPSSDTLTAPSRGSWRGTSPTVRSSRRSSSSLSNNLFGDESFNDSVLSDRSIIAPNTPNRSTRSRRSLSNRSLVDSNFSLTSSLNISNPRFVQSSNFFPVPDYNNLINPTSYGPRTLQRVYAQTRTYRRTPVEVRYRADGKPVFVFRRRLTYTKIPSSFFPSVQRPNTIPMKGAIKTKNKLLRRLVALKQLSDYAGNNNDFSGAERNRIRLELRRTKEKYNTYDYKDAQGRRNYEEVQSRYNI